MSIGSMGESKRKVNQYCATNKTGTDWIDFSILPTIIVL